MKRLALLIFRVTTVSRRGHPLIARIGVALAVVSWLRSRSRAEHRLYRRNLRPGEEIRVKFLKGAHQDGLYVDPTTAG